VTGSKRTRVAAKPAEEGGSDGKVPANSGTEKGEKAAPTGVVAGGGPQPQICDYFTVNISTPSSSPPPSGVAAPRAVPSKKKH
jgi:hypothetical protein